MSVFAAFLLGILGFILGAALASWFTKWRLRQANDQSEYELAALREQRDSDAREQSQRTSALFDRMVEGLIVVDAAGRIRLANRAAREFFGFGASAMGRTILEATRHHEVASLVARLDTESEVLGHELRLESVADSRFFQVNALALRESGGGRDGAILVFHDLTRLRQLESVRQEFVANVSHELRTPLSLIKSATETLLDGGKNDPVALPRFLEIIDKHANRLTLLIDDLLLLSTLESGRVQLDLQPVRLRLAAQEVIDDFAPRAAARNIEVANQVPAELSARADSQRLGQVLSNLVDNAIKYGKSPGRVTLSGVTLPDGRVELRVHDDGPGIAADAKARIFERFYRVDKARSREQGGTGLGLAIVKHVVQAHGSEIRVTSEPDTGTEFAFSLPAE